MVRAASLRGSFFISPYSGAYFFLNILTSHQVNTIPSARFPIVQDRPSVQHDGEAQLDEQLVLDIRQAATF